jgi:3-phenylpropionate/trans-cinnamate dioxygenase alpha subunit
MDTEGVMTTSDIQADFRQWVSLETGEADRRMFVDQSVYELELQRIFYRAWNFVAHDSLIPNPGDFFRNWIGETDIIVVRDNDGQPQVLVNSCRHRGNAICRAEEGHASSFMCTYHGWTFGLDGALVGVPGFKQFYHEELDRSRWGLIKAAQVDSYKGFIFATFDPSAPPLEEYLGDVGKLGISLLAAHSSDMRVVSGIQKTTIGCNWKFAVDNNPDWYHVRFTHGSAMMARKDPRGAFNLDLNPMLSVLGEYGHIVGGPATTPEILTNQAAWRDLETTKEALGPVGMKANGHPNIFPNCWIVPNGSQIVLRLPRGPMKTEMWYFNLVDHHLLENDPDAYRSNVNRLVHGHGPAGFFEQDDAENWDMSTRGMRGIAGDYPITFNLEIGRGRLIHDEGGPPHIESGVNEHPQLWQWRCWADWMAATSWADLKANHVRPSEFEIL